MTYYYNNDYLQHYGVKGMKWGHRRSQSKNSSFGKKVKGVIKTQSKKHVAKVKEKEAKRIQRVHKTADYIGPVGVTATSLYRKSQRTAVRGALAKIANEAANAYISSGRGSYAKNQGVHYLRKAAIMTLSVGEIKDQVNTYRDIREAFAYQKQKYSSKK